MTAVATDQRTMPTRIDAQPSFTVMASNDGERRGPTWIPRAFLVDDQNGARGATEGQRGLTIREAASPAYTVQSGSNKPGRAWLDHGRVVQMSPRALARFQSFPDSYQLPDRKALACKVIGNAVPPALAEAIGRSLLGVLP